MPVKHSVMIEPISEDEFHQICFMVILIIFVAEKRRSQKE